MKSKTLVSVVVILAVAFVLSISLLVFGPQQATTTDDGSIVDETGQTVGPWANTLVPYRLIVSDKFTGEDVNASVKVYKNQPADWGNPRGDFDKASEYTTYMAEDGVALVDKQYPGMYYAVMTETGYNTEFITFTIPNGIGRGDISVYSTAPDAKSAEMFQIGTFVDEDITFTLVNETNVDLDGEVALRVASDTEFRGWKVIVTDDEGFSYDADGDGNYDEGVREYTVMLNDKAYNIFDTSKAVNEFDSNDRYTFFIEGLTVTDDERLYVGVEINARETEDGTSVVADDEILSEGEGTISTITIFDLEGNLQATVEVIV